MLSAGHMRRRWAGILSVLIVSIFAAGILGALATVMKLHEQVLDRRGRRTVAVVVDTADRNRWVPDTATLRYVDEGREYEADATVDDASDFPAGSQVEVVYDPDHPTHAKPAEGWSPSYESLFIVAGIVLIAGVTQSARRSLLTAVRGESRKRMRCAWRPTCCSDGGSDGPTIGPPSGRSAPIRPAWTPPSSTVGGRVRMEESWRRWL